MKANLVKNVVAREFHEGCVAWVVIKDYSQATVWEGRPWDVPREYNKRRVVHSQIFYVIEELWLEVA